MTLEELKLLMGIPVEDDSKDAILELYLAAALKAAQEYANKYDWTSTDPLPGDIRLGILRFVELSQNRKSKSGVVSESIGGMSRTFSSSSSPTENYFLEAFDFWKPYHRRGLVFQPVRRKDADSINLANIPDDITITGTRKL